MAPTVYVTKYALSTGIFPMECEITTAGYAKEIPTSKSGHFLGKNDYKLTLEEAIKTAEELRTKKLKSLEKQIKKVSAIDFSVVKEEMNKAAECK